MSSAGVTQQQLASALGVTQAAVSRKVNGRSAWRVNELRVAADLLGVTPAVVLEAVAA